MNRRNLAYIYPSNQRKHYELADDKVRAKAFFREHGINTPETYQVYSNFFELGSLEEDFQHLNSFVIKPAHGRAGGGILILKEKISHNCWHSPGGKVITLDDILRHISNILFGVYSFDMKDAALIEETITQHQSINNISALGLADIRVIMSKNKIIMAMMRVPTHESEGRANLHQGAIGVGVDITTGKTTHAIWNNDPIKYHPDSQVLLKDIEIPHWDTAKAMSLVIAKHCPLKYLGIDIAITQQSASCIEMNVRPGLTIQNANMLGLRGPLQE